MTFRYNTYTDEALDAYIKQQNQAYKKIPDYLKVSWTHIQCYTERTHEDFSDRLGSDNAYMTQERFDCMLQKIRLLEEIRAYDKSFQFYVNHAAHVHTWEKTDLLEKNPSTDFFTYSFTPCTYSNLERRYGQNKPEYIRKSPAVESDRKRPKLDESHFDGQRGSGGYGSVYGAPTSPSYRPFSPSDEPPSPISKWSQQGKPTPPASDDGADDQDDRDSPPSSPLSPSQIDELIYGKRRHGDAAGSPASPNSSDDE